MLTKGTQMMKLLVLSDTHFAPVSLIEDIYQHHQEVNATIHCGDFCHHLEEIHIPHFYVVAGNNDFYIAQQECLLTIDQYKIFICHGHRYAVEDTLDLLLDEGKQKKADIILYGHTHQALEERKDDMLIINPGSPVLPRGFKMIPTYCVIETTETSLKTIFYHAKTHDIIDIHQTPERKKLFSWLKEKKSKF